MAAMTASMSGVERAALHAWKLRATHWHYGRCASCGRVRSDEDRPLFVARQVRRRDYECLECWEARQR